MNLSYLEGNLSVFDIVHSDDNSFKKEVFKDFLQMSLLYLYSFYLVYFANSAIRDLGFVIPIVFFIFSKKNYFWFAYFFILTSGSGNFFFDLAMEAPKRLPIYNLALGVSFNILDIFVIIAFIKALFQVKNKRKLDFNRPFIIILLYFAIITIPATFILGSDYFISNFRGFFYYSLIFSYFWLIKDAEDLYKVGFLFIPYLFLNLVDQIFFILNYFPLIVLFDPSKSKVYDILVGEFGPNSVRAMPGGGLLIFFVIIFGLQILKSKKYAIFKNLPVVLIVTGIISIFLSSTRSWITTIPIILFLFFFGRGQAKKNNLIILFIVSLIFIIIISIFQLNTSYVTTRYADATDALFSGDILTSGTAGARYMIQLPIVLEGISISPVFGIGLSKYFNLCYRVDLGAVNLILVYGFVGFSLFLFYFIYFIKRLNYFIKSSELTYDERNYLLATKSAFLGMIFLMIFTFNFFEPINPFIIFFTTYFMVSPDILLRDIKSKFNDSNLI